MANTANIANRVSINGGGNGGSSAGAGGCGSASASASARASGSGGGDVDDGNHDGDVDDGNGADDGDGDGDESENENENGQAWEGFFGNPSGGLSAFGLTHRNNRMMRSNSMSHNRYQYMMTCFSNYDPTSCTRYNASTTNTSHFYDIII